MTSPRTAHCHDAVIVGAGFGGMGAAIELRRQGYDDLVILEREDDLGGTWHVNRYPGLAVDIPSSTYSYTFEPNPHWSRLFAPGPELKRYAVHVADKYDLRRHMRFDTVVEGAEWNEEESAWDVTIAGGEVVRGRFLLTATGFLSQPKLPDIPGVEDFAGVVMHTTRWDDDVELTGKRIGVIGTGATAVQLIPELAEVADHLTVYQRTPIYVSPKLDGPVPGVVRGAFAKVPLTQKATRLVGTSILEVLMVAGVLHFRDLPWANALGKRVCEAHLKRQVKDSELRAQLTPDYDFGCKRPTFSNTYYPTFTRPHVDLETTSIDHVDPGGIVTADGNRVDLDVLVLATGFNLWDVNFPAIRIVGREGRDLGRWWRDNRFCAYEGISVPKFPNFFSLNSPYSYSGLSYFTTIETQMAHLGRVLRTMRKRDAAVVEVTEDANEEFLVRMTGLLGNSVFNAGSCATARSYYFNQHGEAVLLRPTSTLSASREATRFPLDDYTYLPKEVATLSV
ncbi:NAD(P)/FAD-dependent oxidoreductase [Nocardioides ginsengisoli]|uniref:Flavin-containing monooxygenase n=1 Tax=Nocardioides ginsengisoli TaxID=363868 RepID=A0ABW3VXT7_9ACTN